MSIGNCWSIVLVREVTLRCFRVPKAIATLCQAVISRRFRSGKLHYFDALFQTCTEYFGSYLAATSCIIESHFYSYIGRFNSGNKLTILEFVSRLQNALLKFICFLILR